MGERLLVQMRASEKGDPAFDTQTVLVDGQRVPFREFFSARGIKMAEKDFVSSCHGCTDLDLQYTRQMQALADQGHRVGFIATGSLYFAKPSLNAASAPTVPGISVPLDGGMFEGLDAFLAPMVPSGTAVIGGVGIGNYTAAARAMAAILDKQFEGVYVQRSYSPKLDAALGELGVQVIDYVGNERNGGLVVASVSMEHEEIGILDRMGDVVIFSPNHSSSAKNPEQAAWFMNRCRELQKSVWVRGEENVAFFAAKCLAAYHPNIAANLKKAAEKKEGSYERRDLTLDSFV